MSAENKIKVSQLMKEYFITPGDLFKNQKILSALVRLIMKGIRKKKNNRLEFPITSRAKDTG